MDRMSQQFRAQGQGNGGRGKQQQQNDPESFMFLVGSTHPEPLPANC